MFAEYEVLNTRNQIGLSEIRIIDFDDEIDEIGIYEYIFNHYLNLGYSDNEKVYIVALNNNKIRGIMLNSIGTTHSCDVHYKSLIMFLCAIGATEFCMVHNHPNQILDITSEDETVTNNLSKIGDIIGVKLVNSIIISSYGFVDIITKERFEIGK